MYYQKILKGATFTAMLILAQQVSAQTSPQKPEQPQPQKVVLKFQGQPEGNSLEDQIARAEFYKAQYPNDAATQAKYQAAIDELKAQLLNTKQIKKEN